MSERTSPEINGPWNTDRYCVTCGKPTPLSDAVECVSCALTELTEEPKKFTSDSAPEVNEALLDIAVIAQEIVTTTTQSKAMPTALRFRLHDAVIRWQDEMRRPPEVILCDHKPFRSLIEQLESLLERASTIIIAAPAGTPDRLNCLEAIDEILPHIVRPKT